MRKLLAVIALSVGLGACNLPTLQIGSQVNLNTLEGIISAYGILLNAEMTYKALPLCKTGTKPSLQNICAQRSTVVRLQNADKIAHSSINSAIAFVKANPSVSPIEYISAAQAAITALQVVLNQANATGTP
jgi:hypothetical protein